MSERGETKQKKNTEERAEKGGKGDLQRDANLLIGCYRSRLLIIINANGAGLDD